MSGPSWARHDEPSDWVALDVETTGLAPARDRIVEVALVRFDAEGTELASWSTLVDPDRDLGPTHIHGIRGDDVRGAPEFADLVDDLLAHLAGARIVAHNAAFDLSFLRAELARAGREWGDAGALCTIAAASRAGLPGSRSLAACCRTLGIEHVDAHAALADARAAGQLLFAIRPELPRAWLASFPVAPEHPAPAAPIQPHLRRAAPTVADHHLRSLADRVGLEESIPVLPHVGEAYLALLDQIVEDEQVTPDEVDALAAFATEWSIGKDAAARLHAAYFGRLMVLALADGVVTDAEQSELDTIAGLLGVHLGRRAAPDGPLPVAAVAPQQPAVSGELAGRTVCFTGVSACTIRGRTLSREDQERLALEAGLQVRSSVTRALDLLVLADLSSRSGKARIAERLGTARMDERVFWRRLGVPVD